MEVWPTKRSACIPHPSLCVTFVILQWWCIIKATEQLYCNLNMIIPKASVPLSEQKVFHQQLKESRWPHLHTSKSAGVTTQSSEVINQSNHRSQTASSNCDSGLRHQVRWRVSQRLNPLYHRWDSHCKPEIPVSMVTHTRWQSWTAASTNDCQPGSLSSLLHCLINVSSHSLRGDVCAWQPWDNGVCLSDSSLPDLEVCAIKHQHDPRSCTSFNLLCDGILNSRIKTGWLNIFNS